MSRQSELAQLGRVFDTSPLSNRNLIINGAMQVAQRGTSVSSLANSPVYLVDRWCYRRAGSWSSLQGSMSQVSDAPTGFSYSLKYTVNTADTTTTGNAAAMAQTLEGQNVQHLKCGTASVESLTLSFWVKSSISGEYSIMAQVASSAEEIVLSYTVTSANTWEYKTISFSGTQNTAIPNNTNSGLHLYWVLGSGFTTSPNIWSNLNGIFKTATSVDLTSTVNATFQITGVQLEVGDTATPFEHKSYGQELVLCQRYYYALRSDGNSNGRSLGMTGAVASGNTTRAGGLHPVEMRASPSVSIAGLRQWDGINAVNITGLAGFFGTAQALSIDVTGGGLTSGNAGTILFQNSTTPSTSYLTVDAEI